MVAALCIAFVWTAPFAAAPPSDESYDLKLREIEKRVNELKEKISHAKAHLSRPACVGPYAARLSS